MMTHRRTKNGGAIQVDQFMETMVVLQGPVARSMVSAYTIDLEQSKPECFNGS